MTDPAVLLRSLFDAALAAADPALQLRRFLPRRPAGRTIVVGAGKAAAAMARAVEEAWSGPLAGLVVVPYGHAVPCRRIEIVEAGHPVPDAAGAQAARRMLECVAGLGRGDLVLALISGGGSALLPAPAPGLTLADKQAVTRALLRSGAAIGEINCVRKHLSAIKGGRLAAACGAARVETLILSDVPGDDPGAVASGPTIADPTMLADARAILARYRIKPPETVSRALRDPANETPKPGSIVGAGGARIVASGADALNAAARQAKESGLAVLDLGDDVEGEAAEVAHAHATLARRIATDEMRPHVLLSGGETTVTISGESGRGGRNLEYLLALALALDGDPRMAALACDTDGIDGASGAAGAILLADALARARESGIDARAALAAHDSERVFAALGTLIVTGPTRTNVNDFRAILIDPGAAGAEPL